VAAEELFSAPSDLKLCSDTDLAELEAKAVAEFDRINSDDNEPVNTEELTRRIAYANDLTESLDAIRAERALRADRAKMQADLERSRAADKLASLQARVHGSSTPADQPAQTAVDAEAIAQATAQGVTAALSAFMLDRRGNSVRPEEIARRATASLAETARHAPAPQVPERRLAVTASVDIPGVAHGDSVTSLPSPTW
jgi:RecB family exonuclease